MLKENSTESEASQKIQEEEPTPERVSYDSIPENANLSGLSKKLTKSASRFLLPNNTRIKNNLKIFSGVFLSMLLATLCFSYSPKKEDTHFKGRIEKSVAEMYDQDDLSACSLFAGNFINFGFWENLKNKNTIEVSQRIESEKNLYRHVARNLGIHKEDKILEVACGQGVGEVLVMEEFHPKEIYGIDFSNAQISRARKINSQATQKNKIYFQHGSAEKIPYDSDSFEKIYSIEAAQHFENLEKFSKEIYRVLKPRGKIVIASFFGTSDESQKILSPVIQTIKDGIDKATSIHEFEKILKENGFKNIKIKSIGEHVWRGFDQWVAQGDLKNSWTRNWYKSYKKGLIDYYLITAEKLP